MKYFQKVATAPLFLFLIMVVTTTGHSQCIEEQLTITGNQGPNIGSSMGQQFMACETGTIDKVELNVFAGSNAVMKFELYDSSQGFINLMWTVDNIAINGPGPLLIDLTTGTGTTLNVTQNQIYSMRFWNTGSSVYVLGTAFSSGDPYPNGAALNQFGEIQNFEPNKLDYYFRLAFNGASLSIDEIATQSVVAYPNPTSETLYFRGFTSEMVTLYSITGKQLFTKALENGSLDIQAIPSGMYFVAVPVGNRVAFSKVIKQ